MFLAAAILLAAAPGRVVAQEPSGPWLQAGAATFPGVGVQAGYVSAGALHTREVTAIVDVRAFSRDATAQVTTTIGGAVRLLGVGRTIGGVPYRGFDVDLGIRLGPALTFQLEGEDRVFRNRRFNLFLEPFARWTVVVKRRLLFAEVGMHSPALRLGAWIPLAPGRLSP